MHFTTLFSCALTLTGVLGLPSLAPKTGISVIKKRKNFMFAGVNESGAEFGSSNLPGTLGTDYTWPLTSSVDTLMGKGFNIFRIPFLMERMVPSTLYSSIAATYLSDLETLVNHITSNGGYAAICAQNFGRYYGDIIEDTTGFEAFWKTVATQFKSNANVIFDTNNEYHDMDNTLVGSLNQAAINGIRAAGATSQTIFVEGNDYTSALDWVSGGTDTAMGALTDSSNNIVYEMHQYLDSDGSGTSATCVSSTIGQERIEAATAWLKSNGKVGIIGETAAGSNTVCLEALEGMLEYMSENSDVWKGWLLWGGGPWWGDYIFSVEPPSGTQYTGVVPSVLKYI